MLPTVEYRDLEPHGFPNYRIGSDGSLWTCRFRAGFHTYCTDPTRWRLVKGTVFSGGYTRHRLSTHSGKRDVFAHALVLTAFVGPCPEGMEACHYDGNPANNTLSNLRWDTKQGNTDDKVRHGRAVALKGEASPHAKSTAEQVREVRRLHAGGGLTKVAVAASLGIPKGRVYRILSGRNWKSVT